MENLKVRKGSKVKLRTCWGRGELVEATVEEFGKHHGEKVFDYEDGWAYMWQIEEVINY